jgi:HEPN domain-containing protein
VKDLTNKWLAIAQEDLEAAKSMLQTGKYLYTAFMCQQCLEKAFKAVLQENNNDNPPRIHNILRLAETAGVLNDLEEKQTSLLTELEPYYISARYPEYREQLGKATTVYIAKDLYKRTEDMLSWLKNRLISTT